jgi:hypothetical protein
MKESETDDLFDRSDRLPIALLVLSLALVLGWVFFGG